MIYPIGILPLVINDAFASTSGRYSEGTIDLADSLSCSATWSGIWLVSVSMQQRRILIADQFWIDEE